MSEKINKDMTIESVVSAFPESVPVFIAHGLHCVGCHAANWETIEQGAIGHGIDVEGLVNDLQQLAK